MALIDFPNAALSINVWAIQTRIKRSAQIADGRIFTLNFYAILKVNAIAISKQHDYKTSKSICLKKHLFYCLSKILLFSQWPTVDKVATAKRWNLSVHQ